jgi:hypothetical protein
MAIKHSYFILILSLFLSHPAFAKPFTIVVLPDTQHMPASKNSATPEDFEDQISWILDNKEKLNIAFVSHVGDVVQTGNNTKQWDIASRIMGRLDDVIPYGIAPGNHDADEMWSDNYTSWSQYFPASRFEGKPWFGGSMDATNVANYQLFSVEGLDFISLHLRWGKNPEVLKWASDVLDQHPNRRAIITTHEYIGHNRQRTAIGQTIWDNVVKDHNNVFLVLAGHHSLSALLSTPNSFGNQVIQTVQDYQDTKPEPCYIRYYTFFPEENRVEAYTYSTKYKRFDLSSDGQFSFEYKMQ